jgi:hypothetical protein
VGLHRLEEGLGAVKDLRDGGVFFRGYGVRRMSYEEEREQKERNARGAPGCEASDAERYGGVRVWYG